MNRQSQWINKLWGRGEVTLTESKLPTEGANGTFLRINPFLPNCGAKLSQIVSCSVLQNCYLFRVSICHLSVTMAVVFNKVDSCIHNEELIETDSSSSLYLEAFYFTHGEVGRMS